MADTVGTAEIIAVLLLALWLRMLEVARGPPLMIKAVYRVNQ